MDKVTQELEVEIDYGVIAAKVWNKPNKGCKRILAIHGWMDNAGSFDKLVPLLEHPNGVHVLAIDLPGHGKSSQLPKGASYFDLGFIAAIRLFVRKVGWNKRCLSQLGLKESDEIAATTTDFDADDKFILLGHSLGAGLATYYASMFPEDVEQIILLDFLKSPTLSTVGLLQQLSANMDSLIQHRAEVKCKKNKATTIAEENNDGCDDKKIATEDKIIYAIIYEHQAFNNSSHLARDDALCLFARSNEPVPNQIGMYYFIKDPRMAYLLNYRDHAEFMNNISVGFDGHTLMIVAKRGLFNPRKKLDTYTNSLGCLTDQMKDKCKTFNIVWVSYCDHYLHMSNAGDVATIINGVLLEPGNIEPL